MECPRCHFANRDGRRFCAGCGDALPLGCPDCSALNLPHERFCGECGRALHEAVQTALLHAPQASPERRQLTAMFCDLVGSTALSHALDPEDLREIILDYQHRTRELIERYDGYIARYMGDGVLAYFGFPHAHEDAAARAVHAALEIVAVRLETHATLHGDRPAARLQVRIGIATGLVVVGDMIGKGASAEAAAVGESINLAARLQTLAEPHNVIISQRTRQLTEDRFHFADHGIHALKGFEHPVRAWRVLGATAAESRFDAVRDRGMTPFVGRVNEIDLGEALWRRACAGQGQVLLLVGEAGIGKSRVVEALAERAAKDGGQVLRLQCSPYHANSALYPFIRRLERDARFASGDDAAQKLRKLEQLLAGQCAADKVPLLAGLLSLPLEAQHPALRLTAQQQKLHTLDALADWLLRADGQSPCFALLEDAHWIDPTSMELLDLLARRACDRRAAVVVTARHPLAEPWTGLGHVASVALERLGDDEAEVMVRSLVGGAQPPPDLVARIVQVTDGVPLFIEEFIKAIDPVRDELAAHPNGAASGVPLTLQDSLMARLDRLGDAKQVAQIAAVLGREFSRELLGRLSGMAAQPLDEALDILTRSRVLFGRGDAAQSGFTFKHALVQEAAYASLLRSRRQELHGRAAALLVGNDPRAPGAEPELIAHHLAHAGQPLASARYSVAAAKRALDRWANLEALGHTAAGLAQLALVEPGPDRHGVELLLTMIEGTAGRAVHGFASTHVERSFTRALALCEWLGDTRRVVDVRRGLFSFHYARGELALAQQQGEEVVRLTSMGLGDTDTRVMGDWMLGVMAFWRGDFPAARTRLERAVALYRPQAQGTALALQIDPGVNAWSHLTWVLWLLGQPDSALRCGERAVATARALHQPLALAMAQFFSCATLACCGRYDALAGPLDELQAVTAEHGLIYLGSCARVLRGQQRIAQGCYADGLAETEQALREFRAQDAQLGLPWLLSIMALGHAGLGQTVRSLEVIDMSVEAIEREGERQWAPEVWRVKAELLLQAGPDRADEALAALRTSLALARKQSARALELRTATRLAQWMVEQGEIAAARALLMPLLAQFTEGAATADLRAAHAWDSRMHMHHA